MKIGGVIVGGPLQGISIACSWLIFFSLNGIVLGPGSERIIPHLFSKKHTQMGEQIISRIIPARWFPFYELSPNRFSYVFVRHMILWK
jgi:hypothetical protein